MYVEYHTRQLSWILCLLSLLIRKCYQSNILPETCTRILRSPALPSPRPKISRALALQVGDIDAKRKQVHIRRGKGNKDRFVPLPDLTYQALRALWCKHRNPSWLFPNAVGSPERIRSATTHMARGGAQTAIKAVVTQCGIKKKSQFTHCTTVLPPIYLNRA